MGGLWEKAGRMSTRNIAFSTLKDESISQFAVEQKKKTKIEAGETVQWGEC